MAGGRWPPGTRQLKGQPGTPAQVPVTTLVPQIDDGSPRVLACAACGRRITTTADRVTVAGSHEHTFTNPDGYRYRIGCFGRADGCVPVGDPSDFFTWFPPCTWQIEHCVSCLEHLGWLFRHESGAFHGLVLDRLVEIDEASPS